MGSPRVNLLIATFIAILTAGCNHQVSVSCQPQAPNLQGFNAFETNGLGYLNVKAYNLGDIFQINQVDAKNYVASYLSPLNSTSSDIASTPPADETINVSVSYDVSGDVSSSSTEQLQTQAVVTFGNSLQYILDGLQGRSLSILSVLDEPANKPTHDYILAHPDLVFMAVNPVNAGTKFSVVSASNLNATTTVSLGFWKGTATITNKCDASTLLVPSKLGDTNVYTIQTEFLQAAKDLLGNPTIQLIGGYTKSIPGSALRTKLPQFNVMVVEPGFTAPKTPTPAKQTSASGSTITIRFCDRNSTESNCRKLDLSK